MQRVLAIGLDGYEESLERQLIMAGELPALARLREKSARYLLEHGPAQRSGLAWEHVSTGLSPERAGRWAAVHFDPETYSVWQEGTRLVPFATRLKSRTVVFDAPYFDLAQAPHVRGVVGWGAHDPGIPCAARPDDLLPEFESRFGKYPAEEWIYGVVWASARRAREMGEALALGLQRRAQAARWLLGERLPDWDLALVVVSEPHSAIEALWHGVDPTHPLHQMPSAGPAREGLLAVYRGVDRFVGELAAAFPDAAQVVFSMGGMGPNHSDTASMVLLPELMYRHAFGRSLLRQPDAWADPAAVPLLSEEQDWVSAVHANFPADTLQSAQRLASPPSPGRIRRVLRRYVRRPELPCESYLRRPVGWIPATLYQPHWNSMPAFALPSFYDGRIRINLKGRESGGCVPLSEYEARCDEIEAILDACRDPMTGEEVVKCVERVGRRDPLALGPTESDMVVVWKGTFCTLDSPTHGRVGPVPFRRPGGHTGPFGMAYVSNAGLEAGDRGVRSSFDVVPTLIGLLGEPLPDGLSGANLLP
ncbi:MAG TPA: alkaline phosphatase family protein [Pyrinomonadaceae bacterium]|jgi:predicted AlkP superfamily phosphohydrolase/phosphomutase